MSKDLMDKIDAILTEGVKKTKTKKKLVKEDDDIVSDVDSDTEVDFSGGDEEGLEEEEPTWAEKVAEFESQLDDEQKEGVLNYIQNVIEAAKEEEGSETDLDSGEEEIEVAPDETY